MRLRRTDNTKNVDAMLRIGDMYYRGIGVEEDINQALKWYTKAVTRNESENVDVIRIIGRTYYFGEGIEKDYSMAYKWFKIAAEKNDAFSQLILGICIGMEKELLQTYRWLKCGMEKQQIKVILLLC